MLRASKGRLRFSRDRPRYGSQGQNRTVLNPQPARNRWTAMTVRLRPHHLLYLLTYVGEGYTPAFVHNLDHVSRKLMLGEDVLLVEGPDDICAPVLGTDQDHCTGPSVMERDHKA